MRAGRFACVALPIILTIGAIIAFMVATLSGITHHSLYIFDVNLENLSVDTEDIKSIIKQHTDLGDGDVSSLITRDGDIEGREKIPLSNLGLGKKYEISLWGYCEVKDDGRDCSKGEYNWASKHLDDDIIDQIGKPGGHDIPLPDEMKTALDVFSTVTRYTEIAFIIALAVLGAELIVGIFSNCTRIISCLTWLIGLAAIVFCIAAAGLATAMGVVVVSAVDAYADKYDVKGNINTNLLACVWIGAAFAIGASVFWLITACCCKPDHRSKKNRDSDAEKTMPTGAYYPIGNDHEMTSTTYHNQFQPTYGEDYSHAPSYYSSGRSEAAYEPYSHRA